MKQLKIALIGYGKMGRKLKEQSQLRGHSAVTIDPHIEEADFRTIDQNSLANVDVAIDFSHPETALVNFEKVLSHNVPLVAGVTGWYDKIDAVQKLVNNNSGAFLYASNFSLGVHIFIKGCEQFAKIINHFPAYDVAGFEAHHNQKADSPSGTAHTIVSKLLENIERKEIAVFDAPNRKIAENELSFPSIRCGEIPGTHSVIFDSSVDTIELTHRARSRDGFALGAIIAAEWLVNKRGFFTIDNLIEELTCK
jgi:4-hydroxy-tetrahydrodipicolinate reductase